MKAIRYLMFLKEKREWTIKALGWADGQPQMLYTDKNIISKQCTIIWHVENSKISYESKDVVEDILKY